MVVIHLRVDTETGLSTAQALGRASWRTIHRAGEPFTVQPVWPAGAKQASARQLLEQRLGHGNWISAAIELQKQTQLSNLGFQAFETVQVVGF